MTAATALRELLVVAKNARAQSYSETLLSDVLDYLERLALDGLAGEANRLRPIEELREDHGYVILWHAPGGRVCEPPRGTGSILEDDFNEDGYATHWSPIQVPGDEKPTEEGRP